MSRHVRSSFVVCNFGSPDTGPCKFSRRLFVDLVPLQGCVSSCMLFCISLSLSSGRFLNISQSIVSASAFLPVVSPYGFGLEDAGTFTASGELLLGFVYSFDVSSQPSDGFACLVAMGTCGTGGFDYSVPAFQFVSILSSSIFAFLKNGIHFV